MSSILIKDEVECCLSYSPITSLNEYEEKRFLISSPYSDHLLDLITLNDSSQQLAILLQELQPNEGYLDLLYEQAFNWSTIFPKLPPTFPNTDFYIVVFRSQLALSSVNSEIFFELYSQDKQSHFEANNSGGLLKYWYGVPAVDRRNLATCIWTNRDWAVKSYRLPEHIKAMNIVQRGVYEYWTMERFKLNVGGGKQWTFEKIY